MRSVLDKVTFSSKIRLLDEQKKIQTPESGSELSIYLFSTRGDRKSFVDRPAKTEHRKMRESKQS